MSKGEGEGGRGGGGVERGRGRVEEQENRTKRCVYEKDMRRIFVLVEGQKGMRRPVVGRF